MIFVESSVFQRRLPAYLGDDEYAALQQALLNNPRIGVVIPGSGGLRKLRWGTPGHGKRGGLRVIYYLQVEVEIWLLTVYAKSEDSALPLRVLKRLKAEMNDGQA